MTPQSTGLWQARVAGLVLGIIGLCMLGGGIVLFRFGGTPYYAASGAAILVAAWLTWRRNATAAIVYGGFLVCTVAWAIWEVGFDGWALTPRLIAPAVVGLALLAVPALRRRGGFLAVCVGLALLPVGAAAFRPVIEGGPVGTRTISSVVSETPGEWHSYGNDNSGKRFSELNDIAPENVGKLEQAWTYRTGVKQQGTLSPMSATPIMANDRLYFCTQTNVVIALDPDTGKQLWRFDPEVDSTGASLVTTCRGVTYHAAADAPICPRRIVTTTFDARLIALDADTGRPCADFGRGGTVDLREGLGKVDPGFYYVSAAPTIARGKIVLGGWIADNVMLGEPSGVIRAFDIQTGEFAWAWDMGRPGFHGQPSGDETYTRGTPNSWAPMTADEKLGLVYIPTGNATPDHWGGTRTAEMEKYSSSVVALDLATGAVRWAFQTVHHDLWDYDVGSQPTLVDLQIGGAAVPALIQPTKTGQLYLLDRRTGDPLAAVTEKPVPQGAASGDYLSATQPFSTGMPDVAAGPPLTERDMWGATPLDQLWCRVRFKSNRYDGPFTPVGTRRSLIYPGIGGGVNWGSAAVDPTRRLLIVNSIRVPTEVQLIPRAEADRLMGEGFHVSLSMQGGTPFGVKLTTFASPLGIPCNRPPYGLISAIDLDTRKLVWSKPLGTAHDSGPLGIESHLPITMGVPNFGGSLVTGSGLIFIAATQERAFRALDMRSGRELWKARLRAGGQSTPMTYRSPRTGRQYVVIVAGGSVLMQSKLGDYVEAFALPDNGHDGAKP